MSELYTDEQRMLIDSVQRWGAQVCTPDRRARALAHPHGCPAEHWMQLGEMGWLALPFSPHEGGLGGTLLDMGLIAEELGKALATEPYVACGVMAAGLLADGGDSSLRAQWVPDLVQGARRLALSPWEIDGVGEILPPVAQAVHRDGQWYVTGEKALMPGVAGAQGLIVAARLDDSGATLGLLLVDPEQPGVALKAGPLYDGCHGAALAMNKARVMLLDSGPSARIMARLQGAVEQGWVAHCAEVAGAAQAAFSLTRDYVATRRQFGRSIGSNQVIQHRLVDLFVQIEEARAFWRETALAPDAARVAALMARTLDMATHVWEECIQLHGAIGMTDEYVLGAYVRRLALAGRVYGLAHAHRERLFCLSFEA